MSEQGIYHVDIVMCIDATGSMGPVIDTVKQSALTFHETFEEKMIEAGKDINKLRIKVIVFRDLAVDANAIEESAFFTLPDDKEAFKSFVDNITPSGGGDLPESGLEAISLALKSDWTTEGMKQRHVVLMFTDAAALPLGTGSDKPGYPAGMPADLAQLGAWWEGADQTFTGTYKPKAGRLIAFAPNAEPWTSLETWNRYWPTYSNAGTGLSEVDMETVYDLLVGSC